MIEIRRDIVGLADGDPKWRRLIAALSTMPIEWWAMPNFRDLRQDILIEPEIAKILEQASFGINRTKPRQKTYDALDEVILRYGGLEFLGDQRVLIFT
jgi:hypothetical protein